MSADNMIPKRRAADWKPSEDLEAVKGAALMMDELAQCGFGRIKGLARLALLSLETPEGHRDVSALVAALTTIGMIAEDMANCVNSEAGDVGCGYTDPAWRRRADARRAFHDGQREARAA